MHRFRRLAAFLAPLALLWLALAAAPAPASPQARVVTLGGDVTEIAWALGRGRALVATDDTSTFPAAAARLPKLGYFRALAPEPILAQRPTLVLATGGAGPEAVLRQLERAGVAVVRVPDEHSAAGVAAKIRAVAAALGARTEGERLAARTLARLPQPAGAGPRMMLVLATAPGRILAAGDGTAGAGFIRLAGGVNAFSADGFKPLSAEAAIAAAPDVIIVPSHVAGMAGGIAALARDPVLARTPAARAGRLLVVDSNAALGFGPRLPDALAEFRRRLARP